MKFNNQVLGEKLSERHKELNIMAVERMSLKRLLAYEMERRSLSEKAKEVIYANVVCATQYS